MDCLQLSLNMGLPPTEAVVDHSSKRRPQRQFFCRTVLGADLRWLLFGARPRHPVEPTQPQSQAALDSIGLASGAVGLPFARRLPELYRPRGTANGECPRRLRSGYSS